MNPPKHKQTKYDDDDDDDDDDDGKPAALTATTTTTTTTDTTEDHTTVQDETTASAAMDIVERESAHSSTNNTKRGLVFVAVDGDMSQILTIEVMEGGMVTSIRDAIKKSAPITFASCDAFQLKLIRFKELSEASNDGNLLEAVGEPLKPLEKWNSGVTWGTVKQPLIVYTPKKTSRGESISYSK